MAIDDLTTRVWNSNNNFIVKFNAEPLKGKELAVKSIAMPDFTRSAVEEYNNGTWQYTHGRQEIYQISITFLDNSTDGVYENVLAWWTESHGKYIDDKKFSFSVSKGDRSDRSIALSGVEFKNAIIDSISGLQWDNSSQNQLLEFTVNIKTSDYNQI